MATRLVLTTLVAIGMTCAFPAASQEPSPSRTARQRASEGGYRSPYTVEFTFPLSELIGDILNGERGDPRLESTVPFQEWYSQRVHRHWGAWGPPARHYPAPHGLAEKPLAWRRERVIATALRYQGYEYQHHHIPDWNPPANWPWKEVKVGHNGKGLDCSNFSAFVYNLGFGIKPNGDVKRQSEQVEIPGPGEGRMTRAEVIRKPETYAELVQMLHTGDLLYIRNKSDDVSHVVLWVGKIGKSPDDLPLIIDSHGDDVKDSNGAAIPCGIHLRPFAEKSWYYHSFSHTHRLLR